MKKDKPDWWPENPYPADNFPMTGDEYVRSVPDEDLRTAISGCLGRMFFNIASELIFEAMSDPCLWTYNPEGDRWDTDCDESIALFAAEKPFDYGMRYCPYCGKRCADSDLDTAPAED